MSKRKNMIKGIATIVLSAIGTFGLFTMDAGATETEKDWKTCIDYSPYVLDDIFEDYDEPKTLYTTTAVNMRNYPKVDGKDNVEKVLWRNTVVKAVAEYNGWTEVVMEGEDGDEHSYYIWNQYLSTAKTVVNKISATTSSNKHSSEEYLGKFTLTAYCNCSKCCGKWAGGPTASGTYPVEGRTVAMGGVPFGTKLKINGKVYIVEDRGTPYGHVDIYFNSHSECNQFGRRTADVYKVK